MSVETGAENAAQQIPLHFFAAAKRNQNHRLEAAAAAAWDFSEIKEDSPDMNSFDEVFALVKRYCLEKGNIPEVAVKLWIDALTPVHLDGTTAL